MQQELEILLEIERATGEGSQKKKQQLISQNLSPRLEYILSICFDPFVTTKLHKLEKEKSEIKAKTQSIAKQPTSNTEGDSVKNYGGSSREISKSK